MSIVFLIPIGPTISLSKKKNGVSDRQTISAGIKILKLIVLA